MILKLLSAKENLSVNFYLKIVGTLFKQPSEVKEKNVQMEFFFYDMVCVCDCDYIKLH